MARSEKDVELSLRLVREVKDYAIYQLDTQGRVLSWNDGAELLKGYEPQEIRGLHFRVCYTPEDQAAGKPEYEMRQAAEHGRHEDQSWRVRKDGSRFWADEIITALHDEAGNLTGFTKISRDLTDRMRMEAALRQSEERYRAVVEGVTDYAIFSLDTARRVTHWNNAARAILGYEEREIVGRSGDVIFTPEDRARGGPEQEQRQADSLGRAEDERWHLRQDGTRFWGSGILTPARDDAGRITGYFKVMRDQTERKRLEDEKSALLAAAQEAREAAEAATRLKDEFLAVASHELRTPLAAILLWAHLLKGPSLQGNARARAVEVIEQSAKAQQALIEDLLDVSRVAAGKMRLTLAPTDPAALIAAAVEAVRPMADARGVGIESSPGAGVGKVMADGDRLQQVAWNLLTNAVKFTDKGGRVTIRLGREGDEVCLVVSDTGRGMSREFLPHVFDRFRQADASTTREQGGLGLGLSIVRQLVELHGGRITAESAGEGKGSAFTVRLPLPEVAPARRGRGRAARPSGDGQAFAPSSALKGVWVLLVEDDENTCRAVTWVLEQSGAEVTAVPSAADALKALGAAADGQRPHVLLSDVGMAGMDGYELVRRVRALEADRSQPPLPAAALTAYARPQDRRKALEAGFQTYLRKPVEPREVVAAVASLAGKTPL